MGTVIWLRNYILNRMKELTEYKENDPYILWLASWYPNRLQPFDGDFIQRHARSVAEKTPVTVLHIYQYGSEASLNENKIEIHQQDNLKEILISFRYRRTGIGLVDMLIYNFRYYAVYKKFIKKYFKENGLPRLVHLHVPMKAGVIAQWIKRKWNIPYILSEHSSSYEKAAPDFFGKRSLYYRRSVKKIFNDASLVTNVSAKMGERMRLLIGLNKKIGVVPNIVDDSLFFYKPVTLPAFRFIHVSGMGHQKNIEGIIRGFYHLSSIRNDWELWLIGPAGDNIISLIDSLNLKTKIDCKGEVSYATVAGYMQQSSSLVMFSRHENFPCVVIEALCCGLPVVASSAGGVSEAVNDSNGLLIPSENKDALVSALQKMMDNYANYNREKIAGDARVKYHFAVAGEQFGKFYDQIITSV